MRLESFTVPIFLILASQAYFGCGNDDAPGGTSQGGSSGDASIDGSGATSGTGGEAGSGGPSDNIDDNLPEGDCYLDTLRGLGRAT